MIKVLSKTARVNSATLLIIIKVSNSKSSHWTSAAEVLNKVRRMIEVSSSGKTRVSSLNPITNLTRVNYQMAKAISTTSISTIKVSINKKKCSRKNNHSSRRTPSRHKRRRIRVTSKINRVNLANLKRRFPDKRH